MWAQLIRTVGQVLWGMLVSVVTGRTLRNLVARGLSWAASKTRTTRDDEIVEDIKKDLGTDNK